MGEHGKVAFTGQSVRRMVRNLSLSASYASCSFCSLPVSPLVLFCGPHPQLPPPTFLLIRAVSLLRSNGKSAVTYN